MQNAYIYLEILRIYATVTNPSLLAGFG